MLLGVCLYLTGNIVMAQAQIVRINIGSNTGRPGQAVDVTVSLSTSGGATLAAAINDLTFNKQVLSLEPTDCRPNPITGKSLTAAIVHDTRGSRTLRFFVQSIFTAPPIPDGPIYTCTFRIRPTALPGSYPLYTRVTLGFGPTGEEVPRVIGSRGLLVVTIVGPTSTFTPSRTPTATPSPTATPEPCPAVLTVEPVAGPPGSQVRFSGRCGFLQSGRPGTVYLDAVQLSTVAGDAVGNYSGTLTIPSDATVGTHQVRVLAVREIAAAPFEVTAPAPCAGDCNADGAVSIDDLLQAVAIAFGEVPLASCPSIDADGNGSLTIDEFLAAVQRALNECASAPPPM